MSTITVEPRRMTDEDWVEAIGLAMKADLDRELRRKVVQELLDMRLAQKLRHGAMVAQFSAPPQTETREGGL